MVEEYAMGTGSTSLPAYGDRAAEATRRVNDAEVRERQQRALGAQFVNVTTQALLLAGVRHWNGWLDAAKSRAQSVAL